MNKLFTGIVVGAVLGVLFAPDKGSETRKKISRKCSDLRDKYDELKESITNTITEIGDEAKDILGKERTKEATPGNEFS